MKQVNKAKKEKWIIEGANLKKLREKHQISRTEIARQMKTSESRLARLENGQGVRDAYILVQFYELIIKHQELIEELETRANGRKKLTQEIQMSKSSSANKEQSKDPVYEQKLLTTRLNAPKFAYI
ncbi:helix-turn-helix transcriptional regulator [Solibacillus silvestris]